MTTRTLQRKLDHARTRELCAQNKVSYKDAHHLAYKLAREVRLDTAPIQEDYEYAIAAIAGLRLVTTPEYQEAITAHEQDRLRELIEGARPA